MSILRASLDIKEGKLKLPIGGSTFEIFYTSKKSGNDTKAPLVLGPNSKTFYALFQEDDVDFKLVVDNQNCSDRSLSFDLDVAKKKSIFVARENSRCALKTLESNGRNFHFVRQSSESGKAVVSAAVSRYGITQNEASSMTSQIKLRTVYSKQIHDIWIQLSVLEGVVSTLKSPIPMKSNETIKELKRRIDAMTMNYRFDPLQYDGKVLDDYENQNLDQMGMKKVVTLDIKFEPITIFVRTIKGKRMPFRISPSDPIKNLKEMISTRCGVMVNRQKLVKQSKILKDDVTVFDSRLENDQTIELREYEITILVKIGETRTMEVDIPLTDTVKELKLKIQKLCEILSRHQILTFQSNTTLTYLSDDQSFQWYEFKDFETVALTTERYPVTVYHHQMCHTFEVNPLTTTIATLKGLIEDKFKIPKIDQRLEIKGKIRCFLMNDEHTLAGSILQGGDSIQLYSIPIGFNIQCFVKTPTGKTITITINSNASIEQLKKKIREMVHTPEDYQCLIFAGKQLKDELILSDYRIQSESTIHMILRLRGGGGVTSSSDLLQVITKDHVPMGNLLGERGAICFGEKSNQTFKTARFDEDDITTIEPFIIEMRMAD